MGSYKIVLIKNLQVDESSGKSLKSTSQLVVPKVHSEFRTGSDQIAEGNGEVFEGRVAARFICIADITYYTAYIYPYPSLYLCIFIYQIENFVKILFFLFLPFEKIRQT